MSASMARATAEAAAAPPIAEIPCSSTRGRPLAEAWIAAARRDRARWRFFSTARPVFGLWKMPTTKTRSPFFRQSLIPNLTGYDLGISTRLFNSGEGVGFFRGSNVLGAGVRNCAGRLVVLSRVSASVSLAGLDRCLACALVQILAQR